LSWRAARGGGGQATLSFSSTLAGGSLEPWHFRPPWAAAGVSAAWALDGFDRGRRLTGLRLDAATLAGFIGTALCSRPSTLDRSAAFFGGSVFFGTGMLWSLCFPWERRGLAGTFDGAADSRSDFLGTVFCGGLCGRAWKVSVWSCFDPCFHGFFWLLSASALGGFRAALPDLAFFFADAITGSLPSKEGAGMRILSKVVMQTPIIGRLAQSTGPRAKPTFTSVTVKSRMGSPAQAESERQNGDKLSEYRMPPSRWGWAIWQMKNCDPPIGPAIGHGQGPGSCFKSLCSSSSFQLGPRCRPHWDPRLAMKLR